jgi:exodeoxyribonuclease-1
LANKAAWQKASDVFIQQDAMAERDVEASLYSGGFLSHADKVLCQQVCEADVTSLQNTQFSFSDARLQTLLLRYKGRNYPESLSEAELQQWEDWRFQRLTDASAGASICLEEYQLKLELLFEQYQGDEAKLLLLAELMNWSDSLLG